MPLTLSHPAAVLPLRRLGLPATVLVIASMTPDLPLYLGWRGGYQLTHSPLGVVTMDIALGVGVAAWWTFVMRDVLVDAAPTVVRRRLAARARLSRRDWLLAPAAALLAAMTHVAWDGFTHAGWWGYDRVAWLRTDHAGLPGVKWSQHGSSVIGLAIVLVAAAAYLRSRDPVGGARAPRVLPTASLPVVVALAGLVAGVSAVGRLSSGLQSMAFHGVVNGLVVLAAGLLVMTLAWHLVARSATRAG